MRCSRWISSLLIMSGCLIGSARVGVGQDTPYAFYGEAVIDTANCNVINGTCQATGANGGAGPNPAASPGPAIQAQVTMCEIAGGTLHVRGHGTGFQVGKTYVSLLYKNGNTATCSRFPPGVDATLTNAMDPNSGVDNDFASMHLGIWVVLPDGSATLTIDKQATIAGLQNYGTVSVREMQPPNKDYFDQTRDPAPQLNALRACGPLSVVPACSVPRYKLDLVLCPCLL
jgi:hypothetical protein